MNCEREEMALNGPREDGNSRGNEFEDETDKVPNLSAEKKSYGIHIGEDKRVKYSSC